MRFLLYKLLHSFKTHWAIEMCVQLLKAETTKQLLSFISSVDWLARIKLFNSVMLSNCFQSASYHFWEPTIKQTRFCFHRSPSILQSEISRRELNAIEWFAVLTHGRFFVTYRSCATEISARQHRPSTLVPTLFKWSCRSLWRQNYIYMTFLYLNKIFK